MIDAKDIVKSDQSKKSSGSKGFSVSPRALYPESIEKIYPTLRSDHISDMKRKQTKPINESPENS